MSFCGCAARKPLDLYADFAFTLDGKKYLSLINICYKEGIDWDYDSITQSVTLTKDSREVRLMVDSPVVLVNGKGKDLKSPVRLYKGAIVVPYVFQKDALSRLIKTKSYAKKSKRDRKASYYKIKKICLDAGHGGKDPGAVGKKYALKEKDINLDIVRRMKKELEAHGFDVIMTRSSDEFISLGQRANIANKKGVDLFISVHSNASRQRKLSGFEVYYVSDSIDDSSRALVLAKDTNWLSRGQAGLSLGNVRLGSISKNTRAAVYDLLLTQNRHESWVLANHICRLCSENVGVKVLGVKGAKFAVLKMTQMPAVLVEVGFLSNPREEKYLKNSFYRQQIAEGLVSGILSYKRHIENIY